MLKFTGKNHQPTMLEIRCVFFGVYGIAIRITWMHLHPEVLQSDPMTLGGWCPKEGQRFSYEGLRKNGYVQGSLSEDVLLPIGTTLKVEVSIPTNLR
jgi:hypothetical protein